MKIPSSYLYYYKNNNRIIITPDNMPEGLTGEIKDGLHGDATNVYGDISRITGNITYLSGDVSNVCGLATIARGNTKDFGITDELIQKYGGKIPFHRLLHISFQPKK